MNKIVIINGTYGVGKTTIANLINQNQNGLFMVMDPDEYYNQLVNEGKLRFLGWPMQSSKSYLEIFRGKVENAVKENNVIIPITISSEMGKRELYDYLRNIANVVHVILYAKNEIVVERIKNDVGRSTDFSINNLEKNMSFLKEFFSDAIWIDTSLKNQKEVANNIISLLR